MWIAIRENQRNKCRQKQNVCDVKWTVDSEFNWHGEYETGKTEKQNQRTPIS